MPRDDPSEHPSKRTCRKKRGEKTKDEIPRSKGSGLNKGKLAQKTTRQKKTWKGCKVKKQTNEQRLKRIPKGRKKSPSKNSSENNRKILYDWKKRRTNPVIVYVKSDEKTNNVDETNRNQQHRLILPDLTAIGVGLSHASHRCGMEHLAHGSVTRSEPTLRTGTTTGNCG